MSLLSFLNTWILFFSLTLGITRICRAQWSKLVFKYCRPVRPACIIYMWVRELVHSPAPVRSVPAPYSPLGSLRPPLCLDAVSRQPGLHGDILKSAYGLCLPVSPDSVYGPYLQESGAECLLCSPLRESSVLQTKSAVSGIKAAMSMARPSLTGFLCQRVRSGGILR